MIKLKTALSCVFVSQPLIIDNDNEINLLILRVCAVAMAAASPLETDQPLLQLQKVDSSRVGSGIISPDLSSSMETSRPVCIPSPYTELGHDFAAIPFYGPAIFSYASSNISDHPAVHQSLSPSLFWPNHGHVGPHIPLRHSGQPIQGPWVELSPLDSVLTTR